MFFSADLLTDDIARKVRSIDAIKDAANILRKEIKSCTFGLEKKHCDAFDLQEAWTNGKIKECRTITKSIRAYSIYQLMVYNTVTDGKIKTPLHVLTGQSVYSRYRSRSTITSLNKIGVSTIYDNVRRVRALLASYAIKKSRDNLPPIPSHFRTSPCAGLVSGSFDKMNMKDISSTSATKAANYCALVVFQDADDTLTRKPDVTDEKTSRRLTQTLPCQELTPWFERKDRPSLPTDMKITSETDKIELSSQSRRQFIINASRCAISENHDETYFTWAAVNALITN